MRPASPVVIAIVVTHDRPVLLTRCVDALLAQATPPDRVVVVDNGSHPPIRPTMFRNPGVQTLSLSKNMGPATGFALGIKAAMAAGASHVWLMDDDGLPADSGCLAALLATAERERSAITCPLVRNVDSRDRLAFPIRQRGRTRFLAAALEPARLIEGFAHLFNGALIRVDAFRRIGLPDARLFMRGDEVEFLLRARRAGLRIVTDIHVPYLHPACDGEVRPILGGAFYAMVPREPAKRHCQYRNRGFMFSRYGMWGWLAADHLRYACHYIFETRDLAGYAEWLKATWEGVLGRLGPPRSLSSSREEQRPHETFI